MANIVPSLAAAAGPSPLQPLHPHPQVSDHWGVGGNHKHTYHNGTLWHDAWVVIFQNRSDERIVIHRPKSMALIYCGSALAIWILLSCIYMFLTAARRPKLGRVRPLNLLIINFVFVEFLMGVIVVPPNVNTEVYGRWTFGPTICRAWLLIQMFLSSLTLWSAFIITVDRFVYVLRPYYYHRRMGTGRALAMVLGSWMVALGTIIPPALQMYKDSDMIFEEVCAVSMTRQYAIGISLAAFFGPGFMGLLVTMAILVSALRSRTRVHKSHLYGINNSQILYQQRCCPDSTSNFLALVDTASVGNVAAAVVGVNLSVVVMWAPFYVLNVMIPFCEGMCVDPMVWSACVWLGYASAGVSPLVWLIDTDLRYQARGLARTCFCCCCDRKPKHYDQASVGTVSTETGGPDSALTEGPIVCPNHEHHNQRWAHDEEVMNVKPYLYLK